MTISNLGLLFQEFIPPFIITVTIFQTSPPPSHTQSFLNRISTHFNDSHLGKKTTEHQNTNTLLETTCIKSRVKTICCSRSTNKQRWRERERKKEKGKTKLKEEEEKLFGHQVVLEVVVERDLALPGLLSLEQQQLIEEEE